MAKAKWNDVTIAESDHCEIIEGNYYFPPDSIKSEFFKASDYHTTCPWKGTAHYYNLEINGEINENAAWYYPEPKSGAKHIQNYVAFWKGVKVFQ